MELHFVAEYWAISNFKIGHMCTWGEGGLSYKRGGDAKGDQSGHGPSFFYPKRDHCKTQTNKKYSISLRATLNKTFAAKYNGIFPRTL